MSKINALRLINLNYNNNAIRISDETFQMQGESTLLSLRNGGGKSVLVQMMMAPFVHKRYRDAKDRPFESYFTTNKPSFIMVEWALDQGAGYVCTGMMVRRSQNMEQDQSEPLEIIQFISEYSERCPQDIYHLPVVEKNKKEMILKNYNVCRQMFEEYKRDRSIKFFYYDMNNSAQSKQYFDKLMEYQIFYKEWETIIKKVNLKESGLSDLFADCKDEKGLLEKWFLDTVESKLNKDKNRMKEFQNIIEKYIGQYKDNQSKIERRDTIKQFQEDAVEIQERAEAYRESELAESRQENRIAGFRTLLQQEEDLLQGEQETLTEQMTTLESRMEHIELERISRDVYEQEQKEKYHISNRDMIGMERDALEQEAEQIANTLHTLECAKQRDTVSLWQKDHHRLTEKLAVLQQDEKELEPERNQIGGKLYRHYQQSFATAQKQRDANAEEHACITEKKEETRQELQMLQEQLTNLAVNIGKCQTKIQGFDEKEDTYNRRYQEKLTRNILGAYEPGALQIRTEEYRKEQENVEKSYLAHRKKVEEEQEQQKVLQRRIEDLREERIRTEIAEKTQQETLAHYEEEIKKRQIILRYLDLDQNELWNTNQILAVADRKIADCEQARRELEKEENQLQKDYQKLTQGRILELPAEFEAMLEGAGIPYVYGMDWLTRNGNTTEENSKLVKTHPFLPYALIMSGQEMKKLQDRKEEVFTSFPIPIIPREQLEQMSPEGDAPLISFSHVSFYVWFNENLMDEAALQRLIQEKEQQIQKKKEQIAVRQQEYREYLERREKINSQDISKEGYDKLHLRHREIQDTMQQLTEQLEEQMKESQELHKHMQELQQTLEEEKKQASFYQQRLEDYQLFCEQYEVYCGQKEELEKLQKAHTRGLEKQKMSKEQLDKYEHLLYSLQTTLDSIEKALEQYKAKFRQYDAYQQSETEEKYEQESIEWLEARFEAITSQMSYERQDLEERIAVAGGNLAAALEELQERMKKYGLQEETLAQVTYQKKEEQHQEILLEDRRKKLRIKEKLWNEEDKQAAVIHHQMEEIRKQIQKRFQREEPLPQEEILTVDFDASLNQLQYQKTQLQKEIQKVSEKQISIGENLTSLADYADFAQTEEIQWEIEVNLLNAKELRDYKGRLLRDYRANQETTRKKKEGLIQLLNLIVRKENYQEDFYRKPIETLLTLTDHAEQVLQQLDTILRSYESLMAKLAVDISVIEQERDKIIELLADYTQEVHKNLGRMDNNSTITIRNKPVKMLKLLLPDWQENESMYQLRLQDFMKELTEKGIHILSQNMNPQEFLGTRVTTRNLYDTVVGIGNVQIKLYKIEEQREYPITWAEVARNSGGEGFLSAFVVLSSLLYYMRKDETDLFAERNEGKVLVMDNPFAQTNAAHLLKPLMDMAKKTNTQLICLSGLGGDSIYGRFDNIYVLNLVNANMRNGMQYLKAEHARGTEAETMIVSQIEVVEQQRLLF